MRLKIKEQNGAVLYMKYIYFNIKELLAAATISQSFIRLTAPFVAIRYEVLLCRAHLFSLTV